MKREDADKCLKAVQYLINNVDFPASFITELEAVRERVKAELGTGGDLDVVNHPAHYTGHASGVECIAITEHMNFCIGNAIKYLWRADEKGDPIENLRKAAWYVAREIDRRVSGGSEHVAEPTEASQ